jgi:hypothetical protein
MLEELEPFVNQLKVEEKIEKQEKEKMIFVRVNFQP